MRWVFVFLVILPGFVPAQGTENDTIGIYRSIYEYSRDRKALYFFYRAVFNVPKDPLKAIHNIRDSDDKRYHQAEGMKVRSIRVETLEPFGESLTDSTQQAHSLFQKAGNALHFRTRAFIIRNYLLIKEGDIVDPLMLAESERLIRSSGFVRDVLISFYNYDSLSCEVDLVVRARDLWSFSVTTAVTTDRVRARLTGYNMFGMGHRFSNRLDYRYQDAPDEFPDLRGYYLIPNISNTFISSELFYSYEDNEEVKGFSLNRPFYSPATLIAGGLSYFNKNLSDSIYLSSKKYEPFSYTSGEWSVWGGKSYQLRRGKTAEEKSTRLITSIAYTRTRYTRLEVASAEAAGRFNSSDLYLGGLALVNRKYFTDRYIFRFGEKEDVPTGRIIQFVGGYEQRDDSSRYYLRSGLGFSAYILRSRYVSFDVGFGTFIREGDFEESVLSLRMFGFSGLMGEGKWKARLFGNASFVSGFNRQPGDVLALNTENGIAGYRAGQPTGTSRLNANASLVIFNPWEWLGFRISPVFFAGLGTLGDAETPFGKGRLIKAVGAGIAVTNVYLVNSSFRLFFGYYPDIKSDPTRLSSFEVWDYRFNDFEFGKPGVQEFE